MPHKNSNKKFFNQAQKLIEMKGGVQRFFDITDLVESFRRISQRISDRRLGNIMARVRMIVLYDIAAETGGLVIGVGTDNQDGTFWSGLIDDVAFMIGWWNPERDSKIKF